MIHTQRCYRVMTSPSGHYIQSIKMMKGETYVNPNKKIKTRRKRIVKCDRS